MEQLSGCLGPHPPLPVPYLGLAAAIAAANGLSSSALNHVNMPAKVLFKSGKLIPVMLIGALLRAGRESRSRQREE